jgi:hypothetical protein
MKQKKMNDFLPRFDPTTTCVRIQYTTKELTRIVLYFYWFTLPKEDIKNTWSVLLFEIKLK